MAKLAQLEAVQPPLYGVVAVLAEELVQGQPVEVPAEDVLLHVASVVVAEADRGHPAAVALVL